MGPGHGCRLVSAARASWGPRSDTPKRVRQDRHHCGRGPYASAGWMRRTDASCTRSNCPIAFTGLRSAPTVSRSRQQSRGKGFVAGTWPVVERRRRRATRYGQGWSPRIHAGQRKLVVASRDQVWLLDWPAGKVLRTIELPKPAHQPGVTSCVGVSVSQDGRWLITTARRLWEQPPDRREVYHPDGVVDLWDLASGQTAAPAYRGSE